jgi:succinate dehydrogenase / fumarate reductase flavoprotein subunit
MGKFAGRKALEYLKEVGTERTANTSEVVSFARFSRYLEATGKDNIGKIRNSLRALMTEKVGVFRTEQELASAVDEIKALKARADQTALFSKSLTMNQELMQRWELDNLLAVSMVMAESSLKRKESRGAHYRDDHPDRKNEFNHHTLACMQEFSKIEFGQRPIDLSIFEAGGEYSDNFDMMERKYN